MGRAPSRPNQGKASSDRVNRRKASIVACAVAAMETARVGSVFNTSYAGGDFGLHDLGHLVWQRDAELLGVRHVVSGI
jgi:hypothetical protein